MKFKKGSKIVTLGESDLRQENEKWLLTLWREKRVPIRVQRLHPPLYVTSLPHLQQGTLRDDLGLLQFCYEKLWKLDFCGHTNIHFLLYTSWLPPTCDPCFCPIETGPCPQHRGHGLGYNSTQQNLVKWMNEWMNLEMDHKVPRLFPGDTVVKNLPANARDTRHGFDPWVGKIPLEKRMVTHSLPVFLLGKSHRQRSLMGCSPWGHKVSRRDWVTQWCGAKYQCNLDKDFFLQAPDNFELVTRKDT